MSLSSCENAAEWQSPGAGPYAASPRHRCSDSPAALPFPAAVLVLGERLHGFAEEAALVICPLQ